MNYKRYSRFPQFVLPDRQWPFKTIESAPIWCSVDLRDGNQALPTPMNLPQKLDFFKFLVQMGFREIEIGFPAASEIEYQFTRALIDGNIIPDNVIIQVLTQSREHIIKKTFDAVKDAKKAVIHLYNSVSTLQRDVVFNKSKPEITQIATDGAELIKKLAYEYGREKFIFEYSPESFTGAEMDYAVEICNAVLDVWKPSEHNKVIINLPSTVEMATANVYADQIEFVCKNIKYRDNVIISLHAHNDRGTAVAATELAIMAGADRVEGTLFGNGERTGNADILVLAMNLFSQGIDPGLDFSYMDECVSMYEKSTNLSVHPRHPYAGDLVYTAFSGSHQDAIRKGMARMNDHPDRWAVPYLPIDPVDVGRSYDPIIRINSQSGKGGVAYILEHSSGIHLPKNMAAHFGGVVKHVSDTVGVELLPEEIYQLFKKEYVNIETFIKLINYNENTEADSEESDTILEARLLQNENEVTIHGKGKGILDAFCIAMKKELHLDFEIIQYSEHSLEYGSKSRAITYVEISTNNNQKIFGAGISGSISKSSLRAVVSAVNKII